MSLVYDNKFLPYYKHATDIRDQFDGIVKSIDKWSTNDQESPDDGCDGIISSVFRYKKEQFNLELIVRAVQILVLYDDDPKQSAYLQEKYQILFDFWFTQVLPELHKCLRKNNEVIRINTTVGLLSSLSKSNIEFKASKDMEQLNRNRIVIAATNVPKLLLTNIHKYLQENYGCLLDSQNVFIESEKIKIEQVWKDLMHIYAKDVKLNVFVDCTKGHLDNLSSILKIEEFNFILVASNQELCTKVKEICSKKEIKPITVDIKYNWSDLTEECQHKLLHTEVEFQNNPKTSLMEILSKNTNPDQNEVKEVIKDFSNIINDQLFNLLLDRQEISINSNVDDSNKINFEILFQSRNFLKKGINFKNEISQEILISITANQKHVLISDIAGSGKSWVVKNISKIISRHDSTRWVTYVDLKQFIEEFSKEQPENLEFENYFVENILKPKTKFEEEIFKKLYKNGKVSIIFDGFDEIAPDCAKFVADLAKLFEFNDGNQLWIVTRDYFEVNLKQKLEIENVYKLSEFTEEDGINFIVASWILMDFKDQTVADFENHIQSSPNLSKYQEKAFKIVQKVTMSKNQLIGLPQLFSMIADGFKDDKFVLDDLRGAKIFTKFVQTMYTRWLKKGQLREDANALSLDYDMNFKELHQYFAILNLFPELINSLFPDYDISEWPEVEIIAGGLLNKIGSSYSFNHETFREYFVADFIFKAIKKPKIQTEIVGLLTKVLTIRKYGIIRMFLNDFIDNYSVLEKVQLQLEKSVEKFNNMENLSEYFTENLEHLAKCVIKILKKGEYENVKKIISDNISDVVANTKEMKMFSAFTEFLFSYLKYKDIIDVINGQNIIQKIIGADSREEIVEYFVLKVEEKVGIEFVQKQLKLMPSGHGNGNIFYHLGTSKNLNENKVQKCFEIFQKYLVDSEIIELMDICTIDGQTILEIFVENTINFEPFLDGAEYFFKNQNMLQKFKNIVNKTDSSGKNILHWSAAKEGIDFHKSLWKLIQKTFENKDELRTFVFQKNELNYNFLHRLLIENDNQETFELALQKLKETLNESDYKEILISKGRVETNLLQVAACLSKEIKTHQILWKELRGSCKSDQEFLKILGECNEQSDAVINFAAAFTTAEIFEFMAEELTKIASRDEIRKLFIKLGFGNRNLLQTAAGHNKSLELHKVIWKILHKYFSSSEILEFIKNRDIYGNNLLINVIEMNTKEVAELTLKEVKELLNTNDLITENHKENFQKCEKIIKSISEQIPLQNDEKEILKLKWIKNKSSESSKLFDEAQWNIQRSLEKNLNVINFENLQFFVTDENVENHEKLWENLVTIYKTRTDLKNLLLEKTQIGDSFIHLLVIKNTVEVIEFTLTKLKENFSESDYQEILKSNGHFGRNLLQVAAVCSKEIKIHQILWKTFQASCESDEEFLEILEQIDDEGNNDFNLAAGFTTSEVFEFMAEELEKIASRDEINKLFIKLGHGNKNLFQGAAIRNKSLELYKVLWKIIQKYFIPSEILEFVKHLDVNGNNLLIIAKNWGTKEVFELTWTEVKKVLTILYTDTETVQKIKQCEKVIQAIIAKTKVNEKDKEVEQEEFLKLEWIKNPSVGSSFLFDESTQDIFKKSLNVRHLDHLWPTVYNKHVSNHDILWEYLLKIFKNQDDLMKLLNEKKQHDNNFIHLLVIFNTADVIEFTLNKFKENLSESNYLEILRSKGQYGRNLLQIAACFSKVVKIHQILWKAFRDSCKSDEEFSKILEEVDEDGGNGVLNLAVFFATGEIFKFIQKELKKVAQHEEIRKFLMHLGLYKRNLFQTAIQNKSLELHEALWKIVEKYFNSSEILQFIKHRDVYGCNVLLNVTIQNINEVKKLTWNKVTKTLITIGYGNNDNLKKCDEIIKNDKDFDELTNEEKEILKLDWIDSTNSVKLFKDNIELLMQKPISSISLEDLMLFIADENIEHHKILWKYLEEKFSSYEEMKKLSYEKNKNGHNFIHLLIIYNTADVIELTIQKLKKTLSESDYQEILRSKGQNGRNLLQYAGCNSKEVKTHKILWQTIRDSCKNKEFFLEILREVDEHGSDVFNLAASFTTAEIFEFMAEELAKIASRDEIRKLFIKLGDGNRNLLQAAAAKNKSLELHKVLWKIFRKNLSSMELFEHIILCGEHYVLKLAIECNTNEVLEFTWTEIKQILTELGTDSGTVKKFNRCEIIIQKTLKSEIKNCTEEEMEILNMKWFKSSSLFNI